MNGRHVYSDLSLRAASLLYSIVRWEPLDMWNASFGWRAVAALVGVSGYRLTTSAKDRMTLTDELSDDSLDDVEEIASRLDPFLLAR